MSSRTLAGVSATVVVAVVAVWLALTGTSTSPPSPPHRPVATTAASDPPTTTTATTATTVPAPTGVPPVDTAAFRATAASLWAGVVSGSGGPAAAAFFPRSAYLRLKSLANSGADYDGRLVADYDMDLVAAHALLGSDPRTAVLVRVDVPLNYAHWVPPGTCANRLGYYEVPNSRVVYRQAGSVRSFGIASMISWEGQWYVVHLGAVLRSRQAGVVDAPSAGPGVSQASSTC